MGTIKVYKHEQERGLATAIQQGAVASTQLAIATDTPKNTEAKTLHNKDYSEYMKKYLSADMALMNCILVTTNWNKNDDVFTADETWASYRTPVFKPANLGHVGREGVGNQTIGVIVNSEPVDDDYKYIYADEIPEKFHILCSVYLWEAYFPETVASIKKGVDEDKMFVSMECLFSDFGYALKKEGNSEVNLLPRNEITAWLTSHLRAYGGTGKVTIDGAEYRIARWLKEIIFSGVGFVPNPANNESIIFKDYLSHAAARENMKFKKFDEAAAAQFSVAKENVDKSLNDFSDNCVLFNSKGNVQLWPM
jgi:hypothetical protein